ncbi:electron transfer flavoprotein subunit beta/FixA family protein [Lapidilactobacillus luobeiensis]|uniref:electron transfer flavoprotein subunit beta/FixA family protein n=1 Tax=Lapidilactobacillus luobeiensis TaxID=2950371 RepID=UPI0021C4208F|nr:electron transfer flavoprotein subunit beta/FixA family protein [Lapidilactobacillus luobeiensis]
MKIVVCIKQVPESNQVKLDPVTHNLVRQGVAGKINPFDRHAIQAALAIKAQVGGEVIVISMGPADNEYCLREGLAMGADRAILLSARAFAGSDTLATGYTLSQAIRKLGAVELVFFGRQAVDADTGQVGPIVAEFLGWPQLTLASSLTLKDRRLEGMRRLGDLEQTVALTLPAVVTASNDLNQPGYLQPRMIKASFQQEITVWQETDLAADPLRLGVSGSPTVVRKVMAPQRKQQETVFLATDPQQAALDLHAALHAKNLI